MVTAEIKHSKRRRKRKRHSVLAEQLEQRMSPSRTATKPVDGQKYLVEKADGSPADPDARYLVLRLDTDPFARKAAKAYADAVAASNPRLAESVRAACSSKMKAGWQLPASPRCRCGSRCRPVAMQDITRWVLEWECLECCDPVEGPSIAWPFVEGFAEGEDFEQIGIDWDMT